VNDPCGEGSGRGGSSKHRGVIEISKRNLKNLARNASVKALLNFFKTIVIKEIKIIK
jgi:hypothetical protein